MGGGVWKKEGRGSSPMQNSLTGDRKEEMAFHQYGHWGVPGGGLFLSRCARVRHRDHVENRRALRVNSLSKVKNHLRGKKKRIRVNVLSPTWSHTCNLMPDRIYTNPPTLTQNCCREGGGQGGKGGKKRGGGGKKGHRVPGLQPLSVWSPTRPTVLPGHCKVIESPLLTVRRVRKQAGMDGVILEGKWRTPPNGEGARR